MPLTYRDYLMIDELLSLQQSRSHPPEHDEQLFIIIHQVYELWFKLMLHEFGKINRDFSGNDLFGAIHTFKRVRTIMKTLVSQIDILETMTPMSFTSFRDRLDTASGFQSVQFREFEYALGYKRPDMLKYHEQASAAHATLSKRLNERSVMDHFYDFLQHQGASIPKLLLEKPVAAPTAANEDIQQSLHTLYTTKPDLAILFESMMDFDEGAQEWRYRHVKLVERTIGQKHGTGGSLGVDFLKQSLFQPLFPDLWAIRHRL